MKQVHLPLQHIQSSGISGMSETPSPAVPTAASCSLKLQNSVAARFCLLSAEMLSNDTEHEHST